MCVRAFISLLSFSFSSVLHRKPQGLILLLLSFNPPPYTLIVSLFHYLHLSFIVATFTLPSLLLLSQVCVGSNTPVSEIKLRLNRYWLSGVNTSIYQLPTPYVCSIFLLTVSCDLLPFLKKLYYVYHMETWRGMSMPNAHQSTLDVVIWPGLDVGRLLMSMGLLNAVCHPGTLVVNVECTSMM